MTQPHTATVRTAGPGDAAAVADLLAEAFLHGDLGPWLIPHLDSRARTYPAYFALLVEQALDHGHVQVINDYTGGLAAAAIWFPIAGGPPPAAVGYDLRLAEVTGRFAHRFTALDDALHRHHPYDRWHHYLSHLAVDPDRQQRRLGSALLAHHHTELDATGTPAYLEATGSRNARLYARHGYRPRASYRITPDGPALHPMWRPPTTPPSPHPTGGGHRRT